MKKIIIVFLIACWGNVYGQNIERISVSVINESIAFPFTRFIPVHPGFEVGVTLKETQKEKSIRNLNLSAGYFHHARVESGVFIRGEYLFRPVIKSVMTLDLSTSLGYLHSFYPGELYSLDEESGEFNKIKQWGRPHLIGGLGIGATWIKPEKVKPFVRQEFIVETPFANGVPVIVHSFLKLGVIIKL